MLMVLTACLVILSMTGEVSNIDTILFQSQQQISRQPATTTMQTPDGRTMVVSVLDVAQRQALQAARADQADSARRRADASASAQSAASPLARPASFTEEMGPEEPVGPPAPIAVAAAVADAPSMVVPKRLAARRSDELMGPPAPDRSVLLSAASPNASKLAPSEELVGPPAPKDRGIVLASAIPPLPFDLMGPFKPHAPAAKSQEAEKAAKEDPKFDAIRAWLEETSDAEDGTRAYTHRFRSGETMSQVLGKVGVSQEQVDEWIQATTGAYDVDRVYAGQAMELLLALPSSELRQMRMEIDPQTVLVVERQEGRVVARREEISYERALRAVGGEIERSLYETAQSFGIPEKVISDMAEILGWDIDLSSDLEPRATFRVVYEELTRSDTMETIAGRLLAVDLVNQGKRHEGFYFAMPDGKAAGYYDRSGEGIGRGFLRFPVEYTRITSNFTNARFHPILKRRIPHYGVDFAAPTGTPVEAVADGRVLTAGWYGGNGRFVKIRHDSVYETGYSHLSRISPAVQPGGWVKKGQIIGYVGSTGLATGPHLHFAMYRNGNYIDPLKADLPRSRSLGGKELAAFRIRVDMMDRAYAKAGEEIDPAQMANIAATSSGGGGE